MDTTTKLLPSGTMTRFLIISDTHGMHLPVDIETPVDVVIHCGDLTQHSKLDEFRETIYLLEKIHAPVKLVIAGNHDFSLDVPIFKQKILEASRLASESLDNDLIEKEFGDYGTARKILQQARSKDIIFLDEGLHQFSLQNGTFLNVYASPYTPSTTSSCEWGFQYSDTHDFHIPKGVDIVITHGPPHGIMDISAQKRRVGCSQLFRAVARAQPRIHCFGHVHGGWGAKLVTWRPKISETPSHLSDIDNDKSSAIENLSSLAGSRFESTEEGKRREERNIAHKRRGYYQSSHCSDDIKPLGSGQTLFVNAAVNGYDSLDQLPWVVDIELGKHVLE